MLFREWAVENTSQPDGLGSILQPKMPPHPVNLCGQSASWRLSAIGGM